MFEIFCNATKHKGRFLFWTWEHWSIGGGAGVNWKFFNIDIYPGQYNPLWWIFYAQRRNKNG